MNFMVQLCFTCTYIEVSNEIPICQETDIPFIFFPQRGSSHVYFSLLPISHHNVTKIKKIILSLFISHKFWFLPRQLKPRKRLTVWSAESGALACRTRATCPTWMPWSTRSRDTLTSSPTTCPTWWTRTLSSEDTLFRRWEMFHLHASIGTGYHSHCG